MPKIPVAVLTAHMIITHSYTVFCPLTWPSLFHLFSSSPLILKLLIPSLSLTKETLKYFRK